MLSSLHLMCNGHPQRVVLTTTRGGDIPSSSLGRERRVPKGPAVCFPAGCFGGDTDELVSSSDEEPAAAGEAKQKGFWRKCLSKASTRCQQQLLFITATQRCLRLPP